MARDILGNFEYQVLSVLQHEPRDAYGAAIQQRIKERGGRNASIGALYTTLDRLEKKGFVSSWWGEPTRERGGRRKRYYRIEAAGVRSLKHRGEKLKMFGLGELTPAGV